MNIILLGPQGSGKGTQARIICEKFNFFYFESGAYLRRIAQTNPDLKKFLATGKLVPDTEVTSYLTAFLDSKNLYDDIVFDGFPRTLVQFKFLKNWLKDKSVKFDLAIDIDISEKESIRRLSARRFDPKTGEIYNLITEPPPNNIDKSKLVIRDDDKLEAIKKRLNLYRLRTEPLIEEFKKEIEVVKVDGERPVDVIAKEIEQVISNNINK